MGNVILMFFVVCYVLKPAGGLACTSLMRPDCEAYFTQGELPAHECETSCSFSAVLCLSVAVKHLVNFHCDSKVNRLERSHSLHD